MKRNVLAYLLLLIVLLTACVSGGERSRMAQIIAEADSMNRNYVPMTSDTLLIEACRFYDRHGSANEQMKAHYLLGCVYRDLGEAPHAVDCYQDAISKADTTSADCDYHTLGCIYSQMGDVLHRQLLFENEKESRHHSAYYASKANKPLSYLYEQECIATIYIICNKKDSAESILLNAMQLYDELGEPQSALHVSMLLMFLYKDRHDKLGKLKDLVDNFEAKSSLFDDNNELPGNYRLFYYYKGKCFEGINQLDSAEHYYRKIYYRNISFPVQTSMYNALLSVFSKSHKTDSIRKYAKLYCAANDSSMVIKDKEQTAQMAASYKYSTIQKKALEIESKAHRLRLILILSVFLFVVIVTIVVYLANRFREKMLKRRKELAKMHEEELHQLKMEFADITESYEENLHELRLLEESHKKVIGIIQEEIKGINKERDDYRAKLSETQEALNKVNKEYEDNRKLLEQENGELKARIEAIKSHEGISEQLSESIKFINSEIVKQVKTIADNPLLNLSGEQWNMLYDAFSECFPILYRDLVRLHLNENSIRVCILTVIGIRNQEQSNLIGIRKQVVSNCKTNLNYQLFNEKTSRSLYNNLVSRYNVYGL